MKSILLTQYGPSNHLITGEAPVPSLGNGEILVKVYAAGVNPLDWKIRAGHLSGMLPFQLPIILGCDIAGVVAKIGADVGNFRVGDAVYGMQNLEKQGAYAEFAAINEQDVALKPNSLSFVEAASIPMAALTSWQSLIDQGKVRSGERVLIHGGAGGVGSFAIQLAKALGAYVATTVSDKNAEFLKGLGADIAIDYQRQDFSTLLTDYDLVLDTLGGDVLSRSFDVLRTGGTLISLVESPNEELARAKKIHTIQMLVNPSGRQLAEIGEYYAEGKIKPVVTHVLPLEKAAEAHDLSESKHTRGKIVLEVQR